MGIDKPVRERMCMAIKKIKYLGLKGGLIKLNCKSTSTTSSLCLIKLPYCV